jgi:HEAT repeat protein
LRAKAVRVGFDDSPEVVWDEASASEVPGEAVGHRMDQGYPAESLRRLRALRAADFQANESIGTYLEGLSDPEPALRYWCVVLLHRLVDPALRQADWATQVASRLDDPSPAVQVAAAHALSDWGHPERGLPVLERHLEHPNQYVRLFSVTALKALGDRAQPVRPAIVAAQDDSYLDVAKVARSALAPATKS